jgi:hypothetical protein
MPEIVCPSCKKLNSQDVLSCQYCGANLSKDDQLAAHRPGESVSTSGALGNHQRLPWGNLEGLLPGGAEIEYDRPPLVHNQILVSNSQHKYIDYLEKMLEPDKIEPTKPVLTRQARVNWLRLAFLLILVTFLLVTRFFWPQQDLEVALPPELVAMNHWINNLRPGAPVLIAIDYPASALGEMEWVSSPVISHLMSRNAYLVFISTQPTGPLQAEKIISKVSLLREQQTGVPPFNQYVNLGYLPGGPAGLAGFAISPAEFTEFRLSSKKSSQPDPWTVPPLSGVKTLDGFEMILVVTENPDTARAWIEQVRPKLNWTPMFLALSVQAEPVVRPYMDHNNSIIQGMVAGIAGGTGYEILADTQTGVEEMSSTYLIGTTILGVSLFLITVGNLLIGWFKDENRDSTKEGEF